MEFSNSSSDSQKFFIKNCSLAAIATGEKANSLFELREKLSIIDESSLYYHFWGIRMNPRILHTQHHNDFATWAFHCLHDHILAEKLTILDPTEFESLEDLRQELLETIDRRLDEYELILSTKKEDRFYFIRSMIIVFESSLTMSKPEDLPKILEKLSPGSIFYHFIDARSRNAEKVDDFSFWLKTFGNAYSVLIENIQSIDPYFLSLTELREELLKVTKTFFQ